MIRFVIVHFKNSAQPGKNNVITAHNQATKIVMFFELCLCGMMLLLHMGKFIIMVKEEEESFKKVPRKRCMVL